MSDFRPAVAAYTFLLLALAGCQKPMPPVEYLQRYEESCAVTVEREGYRLVLLYQSPEYLAARTLTEGAGGSAMDSLAAEYGRALYVRISVRPGPGVGTAGSLDPTSGSDPFGPHAILGERLRAIQGDLANRLRLAGPDGEVVEPLSTVLQRGFRSGAVNTILATFPLEARGRKVTVEDWELVIDDLGLSLGTVRSKLARPKGIRLKVAA